MLCSWMQHIYITLLFKKTAQFFNEKIIKTKIKNKYLNNI